MAKVTYNAIEAKSVDKVADIMEQSSVEEQQYLLALIQGYSAGIEVGKQLAVSEQSEVS